MPGTATDHAPPEPEVVAGSVPLPGFTVTETPGSLPVSPLTANPAAFSAMFTTSSTVTGDTFNASTPADCTVTVAVAVATL